MEKYPYMFIPATLFHLGLQQKKAAALVIQLDRDLTGCGYVKSNFFRCPFPLYLPYILLIFVLWNETLLDFLNPSLKSREIFPF